MLLPESWEQQPPELDVSLRRKVQQQAPEPRCTHASSHISSYRYHDTSSRATLAFAAYQLVSTSYLCFLLSLSPPIMDRPLTSEDHISDAPYVHHQGRTSAYDHSKLPPPSDVPHAAPSHPHPSQPAARKHSSTSYSEASEPSAASGGSHCSYLNFLLFMRAVAAISRTSRCHLLPTSSLRCWPSCSTC
jgi:hypothetical protein